MNTFRSLDRSHQAMESKLTVTKATINSDTDIFSLDLSLKRTLQKFESRRFVGNGRYIYDSST